MLITLIMLLISTCRELIIAKYFIHESWAYHSFNKRHAFMKMHKYLLIPFASTKYYILELSPTSMQCTQGATIKLFCRCSCFGRFETMLHSPLHSRPWNGRIQVSYKLTPIFKYERLRDINHRWDWISIWILVLWYILFMNSFWTLIHHM
jgi:hypothetical protein